MFSLRGVMAAAIAGLLLSACAGGSYTVVAPNQSAYKAQSVELVYDGGTVAVDDKAAAELKKYMEEAFFGKNAKAKFSRGNQLTVKYGYMGFDEGSQAARYFLGPIGGGEAKMVVGAEFIDASGKTLAKIHSEGRLSGGFFGGDSSSAIKKAAEEVATYAGANFAQ